MEVLEITKLVTFGCSWTWGVGANWHPGLSKKEYKSKCWDYSSEKLAFRTILSDQYNLNNINYSEGASSNQRNFRLARTYFNEYSNRSNTIVLWGLTSTARNEVYDPDHKYWYTVKFGDVGFSNGSNGKNIEQEQSFFLKSYSHDNEIKLLTEQILMWNDLFDYYNIPVIWFDTFNTHLYNKSLTNFVKDGDMLTQMLIYSNLNVQENKFYHLSAWKNDDPRLNIAVEHGLLNPISFHPTKKGHRIIAEILDPYIKERI